MTGWLRRSLWRFISVFRSAPLDHDFDAEITSHLELAIEENLQTGMTAEQSRRQALIQFGGRQQAKETHRESRGLPFLEVFFQDLRFGLRNLRRNPGFAIAAILSLALGIGAVVAIFTAADDLLFRPLPYRDPSKLVVLWESNRDRPDTARTVVSPDNFLDWKARNSVFEEMAAIDEGRSVFRYADRSEELRVQRVSANFFSLLGVEAVQGSVFVDARPDNFSEDAVVISYRLWQNWFAGDRKVIGRTVLLDSQPRTVLGVMPAGFSFGDQSVDLWPGMELRPSPPNRRGPRNVIVAARLRQGVALAQAQSQMDAVALDLEQADPRFNKHWSVVVEPIRDSFVRNVRTFLLVLLGAVSLLLIVAGANVANLWFARHASRRPEMAVRTALGASRTQLLRQLLTESLLLACCAGAAGLALGRLALTAILFLAPQTLTRAADISIDWRIVFFTVALSALVGICFGIAPALMASKTNLAPGMKRGTQRRFISRGNPRAWLIAGEIAASVILLVGATLLFRSLVKLQNVDAGLNPRYVLTFHFRVMSPHDIPRFQEAVSRMEHLPGVRSVSAASFLPFDEPATVTPVSISGRPPAKPGEELAATVRTVMPRYFETMGIPILQGRDFLEADSSAQSPMHFIVNEAFARKYLDGEAALGKAISVQMARANPFCDIIGVVGNVREGSLTTAPVPTVYYLYAHMPYGQMALVVRSDRDPSALVALVRSTMHDLDPTLAIADVRTLQSIVEESYARERFTTLLLGTFSVSALLLAAVGIYGVLAYSVSQRTREIGVRLAVGATPGKIIAMVMSDGAGVVFGGLAAGTVGALLLTRLVSSLLFETSPTDPLTFAFTLLLLFAVALLAAYLPARRAATLDAAQALRYE